ncbi:MAG: hypothetical protein K0R39_2963 [Symbiobacteriaceae bacterium]|nr:hypothetical protein [Symbiobacteriaceae bacterium]
MKAFLYGLSSLLLLASSVVMAFLPRISPSIWWFLIGGGVLSGLMTGAWTGLTASAGSWPRLRMGPILVVAGLIALGLGLWDGWRGLWDGWWLEVAWGIGGVLIGIPLWVAVRRRSRSAGGGPFEVKAPLGRREPG